MLKQLQTSPVASSRIHVEPSDLHSGCFHKTGNGVNMIFSVLNLVAILGPSSISCCLSLVVTLETWNAFQKGKLEANCSKQGYIAAAEMYPIYIDTALLTAMLILSAVTKVKKELTWKQHGWAQWGLLNLGVYDSISESQNIDEISIIDLAMECGFKACEDRKVLIRSLVH